MTDAAGQIRDKIKRIRELRYCLESEDFSDLSNHLAEASDFRAICLDLADEAVERELQADVIEGRIKEMQSRKLRLTQGAETLRNLVLQCMDIKGEKQISSESITLSVAKLQPDLVVTDESKIPSRFFTPQPPKLDKKALKEAVLKDGEVVEGVALGNGKISLTIRRK